MHARKAWLKGLSPKQNRDVPPLIYERVYHLKEEFPQLNITLNGGVKVLDDAELHLKYLDGVMIGREVYSNPYILADVDKRFYQDNSAVLSREDIVRAMLPYVEKQLSEGARVWHIARHMLGLFQGQPGGRIWRRYLSENGTRQGGKGPKSLSDNVGPELLTNALQALRQAQEQVEEFQNSKVG